MDAEKFPRPAKIYNLHTHLSAVLLTGSDARTSQPRNSSETSTKRFPCLLKTRTKSLKENCLRWYVVCVPKNQTLDACPAGGIKDLVGRRLFYWWKILFNASDESAVIISVSQPRSSLNIPLAASLWFLSSSSLHRSASTQQHTAQARWERLFLFT